MENYESPFIKWKQNISIYLFGIISIVFSEKKGRTRTGCREGWHHHNYRQKWVGKLASPCTRWIVNSFEFYSFFHKSKCQSINQCNVEAEGSDISSRVWDWSSVGPEAWQAGQLREQSQQSQQRCRMVRLGTTNRSGFKEKIEEKQSKLFHIFHKCIKCLDERNFSSFWLLNFSLNETPPLHSKDLSICHRIVVGGLLQNIQISFLSFIVKLLKTLFQIPLKDLFKWDIQEYFHRKRHNNSLPYTLSMNVSPTNQQSYSKSGLLP